MAELADAADSKSAEVYPSWGFDPPSRHQLLYPLCGNVLESEPGGQGRTFVVCRPRWTERFAGIRNASDDPCRQFFAVLEIAFAVPHYGNFKRLAGMADGL